MSTFNTIIYEIKDNIATITLNRPSRYNAFVEVMNKELNDALKMASRDTEVRVIILTGAGKAFCSGQDLKSVSGKLGERNLGDSVVNRYNPMITRMRKLPKPIICKLNGVAAGAGCSLALACDMIIASEKASFIQAFVNIGLVLDSGSSFFLPRVVGLQKAFEIATTGRKVKAAEALELGMVNQVVAHEKLDETVQEMAKKYAKAATKAVGLIKKMLYKSYRSSLEEMLQEEAYNQEIAGYSKDYIEGVTAFIEKRKPNFTGQ